MVQNNCNTRVCNKHQQHVTSHAELTQSDDYITLTLERPITPGDLEQAYCNLLAQITPEGSPKTDDTRVIQWTPAGGLPRRVSFERHDDGWLRVEHEWNGSTWRYCGSEQVSEWTLTATTPPTLETLVNQIRETWSDDDPQLLVFSCSPAVNDAKAVAAVDGDLRYRPANGTYWCTVSETDLERFLRSRGLPSVRPLSATQFDRDQFISGVGLTRH